MLRRAAGLALDTALFSSTAAGAQPAGLLAGVSATTGGATLGADVMALGDAITAAGGDANMVFIASPGRALKAAALAPNAALPIYGSAAVPPTKLIGVAASAFFSLIAAPEIRASPETVIHMDDTPTQLGVSSSAVYPTMSMFQTDSTAIMVVLRAGWGIAPGMVAYVDNPAW